MEVYKRLKEQSYRPYTFDQVCHAMQMGTNVIIGKTEGIIVGINRSFRFNSTAQGHWEVTIITASQNIVSEEFIEGLTS